MVRQGPSGCFEDGQHRRGPAEQEQPTAVGGDVLVVAGAGSEEIAEFVVSPAEPGRRSGALETPHRSGAAFDAPMVLLQSVVQVAAGPVPYLSAQLGPDRPGGTVNLSAEDREGWNAAGPTRRPRHQ